MAAGEGTFLTADVTDFAEVFHRMFSTNEIIGQNCGLTGDVIDHAEAFYWLFAINVVDDGLTSDAIDFAEAFYGLFAMEGTNDSNNESFGAGTDLTVDVIDFAEVFHRMFSTNEIIGANIVSFGQNLELTGDMIDYADAFYQLFAMNENICTLSELNTVQLSYNPDISSDLSYDADASSGSFASNNFERPLRKNDNSSSSQKKTSFKPSHNDLDRVRKNLQFD